MIDNEKLVLVLPTLRDEFDRAVEKHPIFCGSPFQAVSIIAEELGELATAMNDGDKKQAYMEAAHVAVTAIRTMLELKEQDEEK